MTRNQTPSATKPTPSTASAHTGSRLNSGKSIMQNAEHMQDAEPDEHVAREVQNVDHEERDIRDHESRAEHIHAALKAARGQRSAQAGEQMNRMWPYCLREQEPARQVKGKAAEGAQVPEGVDGDHAQDAQPAQGQSSSQIRCFAGREVSFVMRAAPFPLPPPARGRRPCRRASWEAPPGIRSHRALHIWRCAAAVGHQVLPDRLRGATPAFSTTKALTFCIL